MSSTRGGAGGVARWLLAEPPPLWPRFTSPLHSPAVAARVGRVLGVALGVCFVTGMLSYYQYVPQDWLPLPAEPAWGYRLTQGLHVVTGTLSVPLLLVKLWTVYPRLFTWPPARSLVQALERASVAVLVASALVELATGFVNILDWYPWPWSFTFVHRELAYVVIGSLLLHVAVKLPLIRQGLATPVPGPRGPHDARGEEGVDEDLSAADGMAPWPVTEGSSRPGPTAVPR